MVSVIKCSILKIIKILGLHNVASIQKILRGSPTLKKSVNL
jgi:hypothetical protein